MKREVISSALLLCVLAAVSACKDDSSSPSPEQGTSPQEATGAVDSAPGAECTHPGAGKPIGNDRCECTTTRNIAGEWSTLRSCREGDSCTTRDKAESLVITQEGTNVRAERGDSYSITGKICGDVVVWTGGTKDGLNRECGTFRISDDNHYLSDWCYAASGECARTHGTGCPDQKGQCTGTAARQPEGAAAIKKLICE